MSGLGHILPLQSRPAVHIGVQYPLQKLVALSEIGVAPLWHSSLRAGHDRFLVG